MLATVAPDSLPTVRVSDAVQSPLVVVDPM